MKKFRIGLVVNKSTSRCYSTIRPFKFHVGASFVGKPAHPDDKPPKTAGFPDGPLKQWRDKTLEWPKGIASDQSGHDFFYVQEMKNGSVGMPYYRSGIFCCVLRFSMDGLQGVSFGVADGVGGWSNVGIDPAMFSQSLMYHAHRYSKNAWAGEPETDPTQDMDEPVEGWELTPQECLDLAYGGVQREKSVQCGSSTACIINMNASSGLLRAANLGDSGFTIIRSNTPFYVQPPQTHYFNCPKQLSKIPEFMKSDGSIVDHPSDADLYSINLQGGDIVIAYTDGLSDNLFPNDITAITSLVMRSNLDDFELAQTLADRLVLYATQCMWDKRRKSPFERT
ncbi:hypothetical protein FS842_002845 [Serendipita sp. 407]|nr:hypothetical protein FRC18_006692 [Serendipita sp. 400]KAG9040780.1 hypothetical protein FS842_002845 [Serendipita sp. 407]